MDAQYTYGLCKGADGKKALVNNGMFAEGTTCGRIFCDKERFRSIDRISKFLWNIFYNLKRHSTASSGNPKHQRRPVLAKTAPATGANVPQFALLVSFRFYINDFFRIIFNNWCSGCEMPRDWDDSSCIKPISKKVLDRVESSRSMSLAGKIFYAPRVSIALQRHIIIIIQAGKCKAVSCASDPSKLEKQLKCNCNPKTAVCSWNKNLQC
jgi:hypothetical protein